MKKFVLISLPRSGSSMIINTLNSLENFNVYGEVFARFTKDTVIDHPQDIQIKMIERNKNNSFDLSNYNNIEDYLDNLYNSERITGFKLLYPHIKRFSGVVDYIKTNNIYTILLSRRNKVKQFISARTNKKSEDKIYVNPHDFIERVKLFEKNEKILGELFKPDRRVYYEDITNGEDIKSFNLSHLFPMDKEVNVPLRKYRPNRVYDNILNYNEVFDIVKKEEPHMIKWME